MAKPRETVRSVERVFSILEFMAHSQRAVTVSEISAGCNLPMPTVHRLLDTLLELHYVYRTPQRSYACGPNLVHLARYAGGTLGFAMRPYLEKVVSIVRESTAVAILDHDYARYISHVPAEFSLPGFSQISNLVSLHSTAVGKTILSSMPDSEITATIERTGMRRFTAQTLTELSALMEDIQLSRKRGYFIDNEEHSVGVFCVAVPIPSPLPLAISVSGDPSRLPDKQITSVVIPTLREAAKEIGEQVRSHS
ncbi:MAG: IclR family transcriptional regulator [Actinomycetaceae bacterium]|nr:IclR family transcriptional regulator [Actinomycetaceae bacterium]